MTSSISGHSRRVLRRTRRSSDRRALERWLADDPPSPDLIASYLGARLQRPRRRSGAEH